MYRSVRSLLLIIAYGTICPLLLGHCSSSDEHPSVIEPPGGTGGKSLGGGGGLDLTDAQADGATDAAVGAGGSGGEAGSSDPTDASVTAPPDASDAGADTDALNGCTVASLSGELCNDGIDNDCNGLTDCMDPMCRATAVSQYGTSCDQSGKTWGKKCDWLGACVCPIPGGTTETSCNDGTDNDCDGLIDCADTDCQPGGVSGSNACDAAGHTCSAPTATVPSSCATCPGGQDHETNCGNGVDDDCDGKADCGDTDCLSLQCGLAASQICQGTECIDMNTGYSITLTPDRSAIPADGIAVDPVTIALGSQKGQPISHKSIKLTISGPGTWYGTGAADAGTSLTVVTGSDGVAHATLLSSAAGGTAKITAVLEGAQAGTTVSVDMPVVDSVSLVEPVPLMGVAGSGYREESLITFQVFAPNHVPYPAGLLVTVAHESLGGSALGPPRAAPVATDAGLPISTVTKTTDANGKITVTLYSGTVAGTRSVVASATAAGQTRTHLVPNILIVGAKANGEHLSLICSPMNIPALGRTDCITMKLNVATTCTLKVADRFDHVLGVARSVTFASESGNMGRSAGVADYSTADQDKNGVATADLQANGGLVPLDVPLDPLVEQTTANPFSEGCNGEHNPRDGVVTVIAAMQGEEGFIDKNGNGTYDNGEPFIDLPEPFVDANDDSTHNDGEFFIDTNQNGVWDGPNQRWDSDTTIWAETKIVFTSLPSSASGYAASTADPLILRPEETRMVDFAFTDMNLNVLAPGTKYSASSPTDPKVLAKVEVYRPAGAEPGPASQEGFTFKRLYCANGGGTCSPRCSPAASYCTIRSTITDFEKYVTGSTIVTAGTRPGTFVVDTTATLLDKTFAIRLTGRVEP